MRLEASRLAWKTRSINNKTASPTFPPSPFTFLFSLYDILVDVPAYDFVTAIADYNPRSSAGDEEPRSAISSELSVN